MFLALRLGLVTLTAIALSGCTRPASTTTVLGTIVSPTGKQALTLFAVVPGSILDDYLALNLSEPGAPYSEKQTVASLSRVTDMRAFWTRTGRPVLAARDLAGTVFAHGKASQLMVCRRVETCPKMPANSPRITVATYPPG